MKKLMDSDFLLGKEETASMMELRSSPGDWFAKVRMGLKLNITHQGKIIAVIQRPEPDALQLGAEARRLDRFIGRMPQL